MGFGIAFLGYCFLLLHTAGLGVIGAPMLAYGFFLASKLDKNFAAASVSALFMLPRGVFVLLDIFLPYLGMEGSLTERYPMANLLTYLLFFVAWFFVILWHCSAVRRIATDCGHEKLQRSASRQLYLSTLFILFAIFMVVCREVVDDARLLLIAYIAYYIVLLTNLFFTHTCLVLITSERQYEKDKEYAAELDRQSVQRKERDQKREKEHRHARKR